MNNKGAVDTLVDKWLNEAGFREKMQKDPEGTVKKHGIALNADEWATVRNIVMATSDEELKARVSKSPLN